MTNVINETNNASANSNFRRNEKRVKKQHKTTWNPQRESKIIYNGTYIKLSMQFALTTLGL